MTVSGEVPTWVRGRHYLFQAASMHLCCEKGCSESAGRSDALIPRKRFGVMRGTIALKTASGGAFTLRQAAKTAQNLMLTKLTLGLPAPTAQWSLAQVLSRMLVLQAFAGSRALASARGAAGQHGRD